MNNSSEIMAPAGNWESLTAAIRSGAQSVYFGIGELNMRARSNTNFTSQDLKKIMAFCKTRNVKAYLTLNTLLYDNELQESYTLLKLAKEAGVSAVIAADPAIIQMANSIELPVHLSVQANVGNLKSIQFWAPLVEAVVLARELSLSQIAHLIQEVRQTPVLGRYHQPIQIEIFIHGALCVAWSGKCYMSLSLYGPEASANRGRCYQSCRKAYQVQDLETGKSLILENQHVMSPKDICTLPYFDQIMEAGPNILKIEGRGRSADYVATVTRVYQEALTAWKSGVFQEQLQDGTWMNQLKHVFNRGFWEGGYYLGKPDEMWSNDSGSKAESTKYFVGTISNYFPKIGIAECHIRDHAIVPGTPVWIIGKTTGAVETIIEEFRIGESQENAQVGQKGEFAAFKVPTKVRRGDKVYCLEEKAAQTEEKFIK